MRINVYAEELTSEIELVTKVISDTGRTYHGVRIFLKSSEDLHHTDDDDDRTAITFWFPGGHADWVADTFIDLALLARTVRTQS